MVLIGIPVCWATSPIRISGPRALVSVVRLVVAVGMIVMAGARLDQELNRVVNALSPF
jgi:hypothetical protein